MAEIKLSATTGRALGNGPSRRLRVEGKVPAVVYGLDKDPIAITVDWRPLRAALITEAGLNVLIDLEVDGETDLTIVKELQRHPIRGDVLHVDFLRVSADAEISVDVPVVLEGEAKAVTDENGTVDQVLFHLTVNAKPANIPDQLTVDISGLTVDAPIRVSDVALPKGVTTDVDGDEAVVTGVFAETEAADDDDAAAEGGDEA
jgi:large subunit ribosomal protein L25